MTNLAGVLLATLGESAFRATFFASLVGLALLTFRIRRPAWRLYAWTFVLWAAIAMPLITVLIPLPVRVGDWGLMTRVLSATAVTRDSRSAESGAAQASSPHQGPPQAADSNTTARIVAPVPFAERAIFPKISRLSIGAILLVVYFAGLCIFLLRAIAGWTMARRLEQSSQLVDDPAALARLADVALASGLGRPPRLTQCRRLFVPMATSVLRPAVILPGNWRTWKSEMFDAVLVHEVAHIARRDALTQRASLIYRAVYWFNPLAWWLRQHLLDVAERASDEAVLAAGIGVSQYARMVLDFCSAIPRTSERANWQVGMARHSARHTEARISQILLWRDGGSPHMTGSAKARVLVGGVVCAAVVASFRPIGATPRPTMPSVSGPSAISGSERLSGEPAAVTKREPIKPARIPSFQSAQPTAPAVPTPQETVKPKYTPEEMRTTIQSMSEPQQPPLATFPAAFDNNAYHPSAGGVSWPKEIQSAKPVYTPQAIAAGVEGIVELEVIVLPDGTVGPVRVTHSLNRELGLDDEAVRAARQWVFQPAQLNGQAVSVVVPMQLEFRGANGRGARPSPPVSAARVSPLADEFAKGAYLASATGIVAPRDTYRELPKYTPDGMRAKIQGEVDVEIVILPDGTVGKARIVRSLDSKSGLDESALEAAKNWRFKPGTLDGEPVAVLSTITLRFRLRG